MNILRHNPNFARATSVLLLGALGAVGVGCSSSEEATIVETEITPMTAVYVWPLDEFEDKPTSNFVLLKPIDDSGYDCSDDAEGNLVCTWEVDEDYLGYRRDPDPIDSESSTSLQLDGREFAGELEDPPTIDSPRSAPNKVFSVESFYDITVRYRLGDSEDTRSCNDQLSADTHNQETIRRGLTGEVTYNNSWLGSSIQFKRDGDRLLQIDC